MIKVLFFASLREQLGCDALEADATGVTNLDALRKKLSEKDPAWQTALANEQLQVALNQQLSTMDAAVKDGDEVAFFPPVTGG
ncbi:molybdopterin synthase sulfur carrier subunit [Microbulbifer sp. CAU 1566]|uniref:molybdopterin synthase sulfur carrier subunit n=1 Tax=unclassified Microbulbifer TaxID=2619833 RepID=UPI001358A24E|nr:MULTISPECIES: molybdopterin synthase sulfur carrier subunit [unclassified Microbulbifer]MCK7596087.1 molybdopterin synthase sulfur carrier subunit [Microbulbifer sp. CAU 1566]